ncbi:MAG: hypothetical protein OEZ25_06435 [Candidatus Bathyarchaeota archaeon]|nr:hypothetical protein [Candidatus Bathyarchaeota archaeon]
MGLFVGILGSCKRHRKGIFEYLEEAGEKEQTVTLPIRALAVSYAYDERGNRRP